MIPARKKLLAALVFVGLFLFPRSTLAATGGPQVCQPGATCAVGEFLFDDNYDPILDAACTITARDPDGVIVGTEGEAMDPSAEDDGWYSHEFSALTTEGVYRTQVCCTPVGGDKLC